MGRVLPNTSALIDFSVANEIYDQNKNLDNAIYTAGVGAKWDLSEVTAGEILVGYQFLKFTNAQTAQPGPVLSQFSRDQDSFANPFIAGRLYWNPIPRLTLTLQPFRAIQQTVVLGTSFFTATGVNLSATHALTDRMDLTAKLGIRTRPLFHSCRACRGRSDSDRHLKKHRGRFELPYC